MHRIIVSILFYAFISGLLLSGCRKSAEELQTDAALRAKELNASPSNALTCNCSLYLNHSCKSCVAAKLLHQKLSFTYTISLDSYNNDSTYVPVTISAMFCYAQNSIESGCIIQVQLNHSPPCFKMNPSSSICLQGRATCLGNTNEMLISGGYRDSTQRNRLFNISLNLSDSSLKISSGYDSCYASIK